MRINAPLMVIEKKFLPNCQKLAMQIKMCHNKVIEYYPERLNPVPRVVSFGIGGKVVYY